MTYRLIKRNKALSNTTDPSKLCVVYTTKEVVYVYPILLL